MAKVSRKPSPKRAPTRKTAGSGRFRKLTVSDGFRDFVLDQLAGVPRLHSKAMFGGLGLYADDVFFGILAADVLYLKVNEESRGDFERAGGQPFAPFVDRPVSMNYHGVPLAIVEDADTLRTWARRAIGIARAGSAPRRKR